MPAKILAAARGMAWHLWPALAPEDSLIVPAPPPAGFHAYLASLGITPPAFVPEAAPEIPRASEALFTPFGWNAEAVRRNGARKHPAPHPDADVVRRVNSRAFGLELERKLFAQDACPAVFRATRRALSAWLAEARPGRYVAKGDHGQAGIGQLRFEIPAGTQESPALAALEKSLGRLLQRHGGLAIEQEQRIGREWGLLFRVGAVSGPRSFRVHRLLSDASGGYGGALVTAAGGEDPDWLPHRARAEEGARRIAEALRREGYFGPVGIDLYTHAGDADDAGGSVLRFRPLADLNARLTMAWPLHGLAARFPGRAILLRHFPATQIRVPADYGELLKTFDKMSFDSASGRLVIWLTPLLPLTRHSLAFVGKPGDGETDLLEMQEKVLKQCSP